MKGWCLKIIVCAREPASGPLIGTAGQRDLEHFVSNPPQGHLFGGGDVHHNGINLLLPIGIPVSDPAQARPGNFPHNSRTYPLLFTGTAHILLISRFVRPASLYYGTAGIAP